jgi:hypothetical protein
VEAFVKIKRHFQRTGGFYLINMRIRHFQINGGFCLEMFGFYKDLKYFWTISEKLRLFQGLQGFLKFIFSGIEAFLKCCEAFSAMYLWPL